MADIKSWENYSEQEILEANIAKYNSDHIVNFYADYEEPKYLYVEYKVIFKAVLELLSHQISSPVRAVDMCGGAGKAAFTLKKCSPECEVTLVDISEKMLEIAHSKAKKEKIDGINLVQSDAFSFLESQEEYDLIVFSSAIHHFKDPVRLLSLAADRLSQQGMIITIADPNRLIKTKRYKFFQFLAADKDNRKMIIQQIIKNISLKSKLGSADEGFDVAEYQTYLGIDDIKLRNELIGAGLNSLAHIRYPAGESSMTKIMPYLGLCWAFSLILTKSNDYKIREIDLKKEIKNNMPFRFSYL